MASEPPTTPRNGPDPSADLRGITSSAHSIRSCLSTLQAHAHLQVGKEGRTAHERTHGDSSSRGRAEGAAGGAGAGGLGAGGVGGGGDGGADAAGGGGDGLGDAAQLCAGAAAGGGVGGGGEEV